MQGETAQVTKYLVMSKARWDVPIKRGQLERRQANSGDAARIVSWFATRAEAVTWGGPEVAEPLTSEWLAAEFRNGSYSVWVDPHNELIGVFRLVNPEPEHFHIMRFAIAPRFRGQRLGKGLIDDIVKMAGALGGRRVTLNVYGSNTIARRLYASAGFTVLEERTAVEDPSGVSLKMAKFL